MAQVPYQPVPTATPEAAPTKPLRIDANANMFGAQIGEALSSAGASLESDSDKLFADAVNFRKMDLENNVNKAVTDDLIARGKLDNSFRKLEGNDPQDNLQNHTDAVTRSRESIRNSLGTDWEKREYDRQTMRPMGYDIVNAGSYAAQQAKAANKMGQDATIAALTDKMTADPSNIPAVQNYIGLISEAASKQSFDAGDSPSTRADHIKTVVGRAIDMTAKTLAKTDPDGAKAFTQQMQGFMHSPQFNATMEAVEERGMQVKATMEAARITATPIDDALTRARDVTKKQESGGNYQNVTTTRRRDGTPQSALGAYGIMDFDLKEWSTQALGHPVSREEFLKSPEIQDQIYNYKMGEYIRKYGIEGAGRAWLGGEGGVQHPERRDPLGTAVGDYGRAFAAGVGQLQPRVATERTMAQMMDDAKTSADLQYPDPKDAVIKQKYYNELTTNITRSASVQNKTLNDEIIRLNNSVHQSLNMKLPNGRSPTNMVEANQLDPKFADTADRLKQLDPARGEKLINSIFDANAKQDVPRTEERVRNFHAAVGQLDKGIGVKPYDLFNSGAITLRDRDMLLSKIDQVNRKVAQTSGADRILGHVRSDLNDLGIYESRDDPEANRKYGEIRGALILKMEEYAAKNEAVMPDKEAEELARSLTKDTVIANPGHWFPWTTTRTVPQYQAIMEAPVITNQKEYDDLGDNTWYRAPDSKGVMRPWLKGSGQSPLGGRLRGDTGD